MRKAISLIELIFTIVIIAVVFTVIPKIVLALNKSDEVTIKQDALFNGITLMQMISRLPWDENSVGSNLILDTNSPSFKCDTSSKYRIGGFRGSRNCDSNITLVSSLVLDSDGQSNYYLYNDVDDFNAQSIDANTSGAQKYGLHVKVSYKDDTAPILLYNYANQAMTMDLSQNLLPPAGSSNLKKIDINVTYQGKKTAEHNTSITQFSYVSSNIGQFFLYKRAW